jgi:NADH dehydrogenase FAD-containing subunit
LYRSNEVKENVILLTDNKTKEQKEVPFGLAVWCTGIKLNPLCEKIMVREGAVQVLNPADS